MLIIRLGSDSGVYLMFEVFRASSLVSELESRAKFWKRPVSLLVV